MEVRAGYRQTEVGVIPDDWEVTGLLDVAGFTNGTPHEGNVTRDGRYSLITLDSIGIDGGLKVGHKLTDTWDLSLKKNDIVAVLSDIAHGNLLGLCDVIPEDNEYVLNQRMGRLRLKVAADPLFVRLQVNRRQSHFKKRGQGTSQRHIYRRDFESLRIPFPSVAEQHAIATALSDVDALLGGLDQLIAKKRDLKQAAMQQLLTGQTRLPGFDGDWEVKTLKQAAVISPGINKPISEMGSGSLYVTVQDLYDGTSIRTTRLSRINVSPAEIEAKSLSAGDIVFGKSSVKRDGIGYPSQFLGCGEAVVFSGFTYRARACQGETDPTFLFYALRTEKTRRWLIDNSQSSALTNINQTIADVIPIMMPPTLSEQTAIAAVLSDMDAELAALETRRNKTRDLKQAMMQELLTGKTRLVTPEVPHA